MSGVKRLKFIELGCGDHFALSPVGSYRICEDGDHGWVVIFDGAVINKVKKGEKFSTPEDAIAWAQKKHESNILACLTL